MDDPAGQAMSVESLDALDSIAFYAATTRRDIDTLEVERDTKVAAILESYKEQIDQLRSKYNQMIKVIFAYMTDHQAELFVDKKSRELLHATLKITDSDELVVKDEQAVVALLKALKRPDLIRTIESIKKEFIREDVTLLSQIPDLSIGHNRTYTIILKPKPSDDKSSAQPIRETKKVSLD